MNLPEPDPEFNFNRDELEPVEEEQPVNPYTTWVTLAGLILAVAMLGSMILRAFPPQVLRNVLSNGQRAAPLELPVSVRVGAEAGWVDTGLELAANRAYRLSARGEVVLSDQAGFDQPTGAAGFNSSCQPTADSTCALNGAPYGALIARIDSSDPFVVGNLLVFDTGSSGRLWLAINDLEDGYRDNEGHLVVRVEPFEDSRFDTASILQTGNRW